MGFIKNVHTDPIDSPGYRLMLLSIGNLDHIYDILGTVKKCGPHTVMVRIVGGRRTIGGSSGSGDP